MVGTKETVKTFSKIFDPSAQNQPQVAKFLVKILRKNHKRGICSNLYITTFNMLIFYEKHKTFNQTNLEGNF